MNEQVYVSIRLDNGQVAIMGFLTKARGTSLPYGASWDPVNPGWWLRPATDAAVFAEISRAFSAPGSPQPIAWRVVNLADIPTEREYRAAYSDDGVSMGYDMPAARSIHLAKLRRERDVALAALDGAWMRATGQRDTVEANRIEAERQALRDMPTRVAPLLAAAGTIEQLKLVV